MTRWTKWGQVWHLVEGTGTYCGRSWHNSKGRAETTVRPPNNKVCATCRKSLRHRLAL